MIVYQIGHTENQISHGWNLMWSLY